jgi:hypothetical protein
VGIQEHLGHLGKGRIVDVPAVNQDKRLDPLRVCGSHVHGDRAAPAVAGQDDPLPPECIGDVPDVPREVGRGIAIGIERRAGLIPPR